jgi:hypothetical protein
MARLSKTSPFQIYNDGNTTSETTQRPDFDENVEEQEEPDKPFAWTRKDDGFVTESDEERTGLNDDGALEGDDEKNYTRTSISSFPESSYPTDYERTPMHKPYTPQYARPSSRRMQMSSPLRKGKYGTPYSEPRGSPRSRRKDFDADNDSHDPKRFPLILLHITALPMNISWSRQAMRETLPHHILDNLQLLKSKLSATVLKRGILIPHPRDDYELLEEKLLEALELQEPRISKCGHYRNRHSTDSTVTTASSSPDSGVGSSVDESDEEHCSTCHHHLQAAGSGKQKWSIKVYAANGLMRASAWHAAWSEMERVDVEIMPWIKDELRLKLDEANMQELVVTNIDLEADELRINQLVEERLRLLEQDSDRAREAEMSREIERIVINEQRQFSQAAQEASTDQTETAKHAEHVPESEPISTELPNIYRPKDIPLSILLRNYVFLLARKPKNMAMFFLVLLTTGLLAIMGPAPMAAAVTDVSALVTAKTANVGLPWGAPSATEHHILSTSEIPTRADSEAEVPSETFAEADTDMVTVSDSVLKSEGISSAWTEERPLKDAHAHAEQVAHHISKGSETLTEQMPDSENMASEVARPQTPDMVVSLDSSSDLGVADPSSVDSRQAEQGAGQNTFEQSEVEDQPKVPSAPANVDITLASGPREKGDDSIVASGSPRIEQLESCWPQSLFSVNSAFCGLVDEEDDDQVNESFTASSSSHVGQMHQSSPYSLLFEHLAVCKLDDEISTLAE